MFWKKKPAATMLPVFISAYALSGDKRCSLCGQKKNKFLAIIFPKESKRGRSVILFPIVGNMFGKLKSRTD